MIPNFYLLAAIIKDKYMPEHYGESIVRACNEESAWEAFNKFIDAHGITIVEKLKATPFPVNDDSKVIFYSPYSSLKDEIDFD